MVNQYDGVRLKDGRDGCIVEVLKPGIAYYLDVGAGTPEDPWDGFDIRHEDIAEVTYRHTV